MPSAKEYFKMKQESRHQGDYEQEIRKHRRKVIVRSLLCVLILVAVAGGVWFYNQARAFDGIRVLSEMERTDTEGTLFLPYGDNVLQYNSDGISCADKDNHLLWNQSFEMKTPLVDICKKYVAVCDKDGNKVYILNEKGLAGEVETQLPVKKIQVAGQGVVAVLMKDGDVNRINYYDKAGNLLAENKSPVEKSGFPIDISLSEDGMKLAVAYMQVVNGSVQSKLAFYNFDSVGENEIDHLVSAANWEDSVIAQVEFVNSTTAFVFGNNKFGVYRGTQKPVSVFEKKLKSELRSVFYNEQYIGLVFASANVNANYRIELYNLKGSKISSFETDMLYDEILLNKGLIYLKNGAECAIYNLKGKEKYRGSLEENIEAIIPLSERKVIAVLENKKQVIRFR